jgi:hypothetical protein
MAEALIELGRAAHLQGNQAQAATYFRAGLRLFANLLGKQTGIAQCLVGLAGVFAAQGQPRRAAQLFGAADARHEALGIPVQADAQAIYLYDVTMIHAQLDDTVFATEWAEGRRLTVEQAVALALEENGQSRPGADRLLSRK